MKKPKIFRRRYIPDELVDISADELLYRTEELLVTRWSTIRPKADFAAGISYAFLREGFKISRFYGSQGDFKFWYCDIIDVEYDEDQDAFTLNDLLVDIKIMPEGAVYILDSDELAEALEKGLIGPDQACRALKRLDKLLKMIYAGQFPPEECKKLKFDA